MLDFLMHALHMHLVALSTFALPYEFMHHLYVSFEMRQAEESRVTVLAGEPSLRIPVHSGHMGVDVALHGGLQAAYGTLVTSSGHVLSPYVIPQAG